MKIKGIEVRNYDEVVENFKTSSTEKLLWHKDILLKLQECEKCFLDDPEIQRKVCFTQETIDIIDKILLQREMLKR